MNARNIGLIVAGLAIAGLLGYTFLAQPSGTGGIDDPNRVEHAVADLKNPKQGSVIKTKIKEVAPVAKPVADGGIPTIELADQPDLPIDPMDHYPLNKQGFEGAFQEMQIEFDACRAERGVKMPDAIEVLIRVVRESPPHEEYGIEEGEIWGMVKQVQVVGADPQKMKPFTDCVQDNLYDLLFTPPTLQEVNVKRPMTFKR